MRWGDTRRRVASSVERARYSNASWRRSSTAEATARKLASSSRRPRWAITRTRSTDERTRRTVSPQRITHYRDNWYLDAWDHDREALRSFAVDRITQARLLDEAARDLDEAVLDQHLASSYGIFSGEPRGWATIVFSPKVARWVADEHWHSRQQGRFLPDGRYELKLPYSVPRELLMDILHYGADAEIIEPAVLREQARSLLSLALSQYD